MVRRAADRLLNMFVEAFVAQPADQALDETILHGLAGGDVGYDRIWWLTRKAAYPR
jgi:hypothetical protein